MGGNLIKKLSFIGCQLFIIFIIALSVRVYKLGESPRSVNWDEAALGYNAYALLKTGHDEFGKYFPLSLQSFDDYKPALYAYFAVLPIAGFGLSDITTRLPSAIFGSILPIILIILITKITKNFKLGLLSGLFLSFEPWSIHFSRIAFEANISMVLMYVGVVSIIVFKRPFWGLFFGILSMYGYHAQRMVAIPIIGLMTFLKYWLEGQKLQFNLILINMLTICILLLPLMINFTQQPITARFASTSIFKLAPFVPKDLSENYSEYLAFGNQIIGRYLAYFSPANLFVRGSTEPILKISGQGLLNSCELIFFLIGLIQILRHWRRYVYLLPITLIAPLSGVITWNWFSVIRTLSLYPIFSFVVAMGILKINKLVLILFIPFWVFTISNEIAYLPVENYGEFQPGFEESVPYVISRFNLYDKIIVNSPQSAPYIFYNFYGKLDPAYYKTGLTSKGTNAGTEDGYINGKFEFRKILFEKDSLNKNWLIAGTAVSIKDGLTNTKDFYDPKGYVSVRVYEPINQK